MNNPRKRLIWRRLGGPLTAAVLLASAGVAGAATAEAEPELKSTTETVSVQNITVTDGENRVEVRVIDGEVFVKVNGERRPSFKLAGDWEKFPITIDGKAEPIATVIRDGKNDRVVVMAGSTDGEDVKQIKQKIKLDIEAQQREIERLGEEIGWGVEIDAEGLRALEGLGNEFFFPEVEGVEIDVQGFIGPEAMREIELLIGEATGGFPAIVRTLPANQPKSMIGITMAVETMPEGEVVIIEDVMDGMPASKAGLRAGDRIVEIKSVGLGTEENIRRVTREFEPGQKVKLRVLRGEEVIETELELAPYRTNLIGRLATTEEAVAGQRFFTFERDARDFAELGAMRERLEAQVAEKRVLIEELAKQMADAENAEAIATRIQSVARELEESVRRLGEEEMRQRVQREAFNSLRAESGGAVIIGRGGEGQRPLVLTVPSAPTPPTPPAGAQSLPGIPAPPAVNVETRTRIDSLEQRLDRLESSTQRIEEMLMVLMRQMAERG